jgi:predicted DNA-binding transcriptional regulator AlpA
MHEQWLSGPIVDERYGISAMTRWRWQRNPKLRFPKPIAINGRKYWSLKALEEWERTRPRQED